MLINKELISQLLKDGIRRESFRSETPTRVPTISTTVSFFLLFPFVTQLPGKIPTCCRFQ